MNFALAIDKPLGLSSSDVVIKCRNALSKAVGSKVKCGHMGTLDPAADGVLVLGFGKATKLFDYMQGGKKVYKAVFTFGKTTDTLDREGVVLDENRILPDVKALKSVLDDFIGEIDQVPPAYSAVNVNGVRAYKLARKGADVNLSAKKVVIYALNILNVDADAEEKVRSVKLEIVCGSGTYIRSLCRDIAEKLGTISYMSALRRTACAGYSEADAVEMDKFISDPLSYVRPDREIVEKLFEMIQVDEETSKRLRFGQSIKTQLKEGRTGVECGEELLGVALVKDGCIKLETHLWNTI